MADILKALHANKQLISYNEAHLDKILKRTIQAGMIIIVHSISNNHDILSIIHCLVALTLAYILI